MNQNNTIHLENNIKPINLNLNNSRNTPFSKGPYLNNKYSVNYK